ncbi:glycosyltransferase family 2 protein [Chitinibacter bivalviorum]|uniref:Glycosyltransferase family 2 protein n=1 Tax=Chitinibacter bivalviorum TaxID=2739434 RepID=A0A7H9BHI4_9NEIS|nr:glycosyltransferase family 2 protein [Chitinibacter bivalviorum]QLG87792.1 glycosyltransferase family 2 protein [Chitinibacter bivalviorum]
MLIETLQSTLGLASMAAAIYTLPGSWALARWTWAARHPMPSVQGPSSNEAILILVPAHNEAATIPRTLPPLMAQSKQDGNSVVVVIADNCTDLTAQIARDLGAIVLERHNETARGKGHALAYAFQTYPDTAWYLIVDADSSLDDDFLFKLRQKISEDPAAIQARYTPDCAADDPRATLKHWALQAFNINRQRGRAKLGESVSLLGNGFALSASTLNQVPYRAGSIVEDFEYQLALQAAGLKISWLEEVAVHGEMPSGSGEKTQRVRWEGGRIAMLRQHCLPLLKQITQGQHQAWSALQELMLLPLNLHALLLLIACLGNSWTSLMGVIGLLILIAHAGFALSELPAGERSTALLSLPRYLIWKLIQLPAILRSSTLNSPWLRSERQAERSRPL